MQARYGTRAYGSLQWCSLIVAVPVPRSGVHQNGDGKCWEFDMNTFIRLLESIEDWRGIVDGIRIGKDFRKRREKERMNLQIQVEWMGSDDLIPLRWTESWQKGRIERRWMGRNNGTWLVWMSVDARRGMERNVGRNGSPFIEVVNQLALERLFVGGIRQGWRDAGESDRWRWGDML